jgi:hypothetical protein
MECETSKIRAICGLIYDHEDESRTRRDEQRRKYSKMDKRAKD